MPISDIVGDTPNPTSWILVRATTFTPFDLVTMIERATLAPMELGDSPLVARVLDGCFPDGHVAEHVVRSGERPDQRGLSARPIG